MNKGGIWKWLILVGLVSWSLMVVMPIDEKVKLGLDLRGGTSFTLEIDDSQLESKEDKKEARQRALEIIRNRVDSMGTEEPIIYPVPDSNRIVVQMPGLKEEDRDNALRTLEQKAFLEFRMVHPKNGELVDALFEKGSAPNGYKIISHAEQGPAGQTVERQYYKPIKTEGLKDVDPQKVEKKLKRFEAPPGYEFMLEEVEIKPGVTGYRPYFVHRKRELTGEFITDAGVDYQRFGQPMVSLKLDSEGKRRFRNVTKDYAPNGEKNPEGNQRFLAIVLDGTLYSAPFIKTPIYNGEAIIEGTFSVQEAQRLATVLQAGSLPTPVDLVEERGVDPSLGRDSIKSGKRAAIFAGIAVVAFMLIYYLGAGVVANLALVLDILLLPLGMLVVSGFLSFFTGETGAAGGKLTLPTLTLPGIAGIVLTIGMAVDANVLIFERIREEQRSGKRFLSAVSAGYEKAFSTIFDANITTLLTAVILFWQGAGAVRGFAITLSAGIVVSMYTVLVVTRMLFNLVGEHSDIKQIKMLRLLGDTNIDFLSKRKIAAVISGLIIIATWGAFIQNGADNFGVDFTGGTSLTFNFEEKVSVQDIRDTLAEAGVSDPFIQYQNILSADNAKDMNEFMELKVGHEEGELAKNTITETFSEQKYKNIKTDSVGPQVGEELKEKGIYAIVFALIGIVIYISLRFEFAFAAGAITALLHDVLITIGIFCILGNQLSLPIVAALLTIVGYSVNDTIVVFDRIREDLKLLKGRPYKEICNISINQTLSRTLLTSLTTLLSVTILLLFGGGAIQDFALALFIGVLVGTYSSIFVATPVVLFWHKEEDKAKSDKKSKKK